MCYQSSQSINFYCGIGCCHCCQWYNDIDAVDDIGTETGTSSDAVADAADVVFIAPIAATNSIASVMHLTTQSMLYHNDIFIL